MRYRQRERQRERERERERKKERKRGKERERVPNMLYLVHGSLSGSSFAEQAHRVHRPTMVRAYSLSIPPDAVRLTYFVSV